MAAVSYGFVKRGLYGMYTLYSLSRPDSSRTNPNGAVIFSMKTWPNWINNDIVGFYSSKGFQNTPYMPI